jgi:ribonucleoside-triphosphate reductase
VKKSRFELKGGMIMTQTKCEVYSRVVGYIRPVEQWNDGKQAEFKDRKQYEFVKSTKEEQASLC